MFFLGLISPVPELFLSFPDGVDNSVLKSKMLVTPYKNLTQNTHTVLASLESGLPATGQNRTVICESGFIMLNACWESFLEELLTNALNYILSNVTDVSQLPANLRKLMARKIREDEGNITVHDLTENGWKRVLIEYKNELIAKYVSSLHTRDLAYLDQLFKELLDINELSRHWIWEGTSAPEARQTLNYYIGLKTSLTRQVGSSQDLDLDKLKSFTTFILHLGDLTSSVLQDHVNRLIIENVRSLDDEQNSLIHSTMQGRVNLRRSLQS